MVSLGAATSGQTPQVLLVKKLGPDPNTGATESGMGFSRITPAMAALICWLVPKAPRKTSKIKTRLLFRKRA
jgi:hypothetical protein